MLLTSGYGYLQGRVKFPIGGIVRKRESAGFGEIPKLTVIVWMEEDKDMRCVSIYRRRIIFLYFYHLNDMPFR